MADKKQLQRAQKLSKQLPQQQQQQQQPQLQCQIYDADGNRSLRKTGRKSRIAIDVQYVDEKAGQFSDHEPIYTTWPDGEVVLSYNILAQRKQISTEPDGTPVYNHPYRSAPGVALTETPDEARERQKRCMGRVLHAIEHFEGRLTAVALQECQLSNDELLEIMPAGWRAFGEGGCRVLVFYDGKVIVVRNNAGDSELIEKIKVKLDDAQLAEIAASGWRPIDTNEVRVVTLRDGGGDVIVQGDYARTRIARKRGCARVVSVMFGCKMLVGAHLNWYPKENESAYIAQASGLSLVIRSNLDAAWKIAEMEWREQVQLTEKQGQTGGAVMEFWCMLIGDLNMETYADRPDMRYTKDVKEFFPMIAQSLPRRYKGDSFRPAADYSNSRADGGRELYTTVDHAALFLGMDANPNNNGNQPHQTVYVKLVTTSASESVVVASY